MDLSINTSEDPDISIVFPREREVDLSKFFEGIADLITSLPS